MKSKLLKYLSFIPSVIVIVSLIFFYGKRLFSIETQPVEGVMQNLLTVWLSIIIIAIFLVLSLMIVYIFHLVVYNKKMSFYKKLIWLFALWFLNVLVLPIYYLMYMKEKPLEVDHNRYDE